jgi:hypothetical protein
MSEMVWDGTKYTEAGPPKSLLQIADEMDALRLRLVEYGIETRNGESFARIPREMVDDLLELGEWLKYLPSTLRGKTE